MRVPLHPYYINGTNINYIDSRVLTSQVRTWSMCSPSPVSLQESDESFQLFIGRCCTRSVAPLEQTLVDITKVQHLLALPKALVQLYNQILENNSQANQGLRDTMVSSYLFHLLLSVLSVRSHGTARSH